MDNIGLIPLGILTEAPVLAVAVKLMEEVTSVRAPPFVSEERGRKRWDSRHSVDLTTPPSMCCWHTEVELRSGMV